MPDMRKARLLKEPWNGSEEINQEVKRRKVETVEGLLKVKKVWGIQEKYSIWRRMQSAANLSLAQFPLTGKFAGNIGLLNWPDHVCDA